MRYGCCRPRERVSCYTYTFWSDQPRYVAVPARG